MTVQDVAKELKLDWHTVKALDKEYMEEQLRRYSCCGSWGDRDRRDFVAEGASVSDCSERSGAGAARSGTVGMTDPKRVWIGFTNGLEPRRRRRSGWP